MNQSHPKKIFLASGSPRRRELLEQIGLPFEVMISEVDETTEYTSPQDVVRDLSAQKAQAVWQQLSREQQEESVVLGADTIVAYEGAIQCLSCFPEGPIRSIPVSRFAVAGARSLFLHVRT